VFELALVLVLVLVLTLALLPLLLLSLWARFWAARVWYSTSGFDPERIRVMPVVGVEPG
jgi:apolipoprotein N-acyltransferase